MVLKITCFENKFKIEGELSKNTLPQFRQAFRTAFLETDQLTLDINSLIRIDRYGVNALAKLHNEAILKGKVLRIIGLNNPEIFAEINKIDAA